MVKIKVLMQEKRAEGIFPPSLRKKLERLGEVEWCTGEAFPTDIAPLIRDCDVVITGWGTPLLKREALEGSRVRLIAHSAGSVRPVVEEDVFDMGITVTSVSRAIAPFVAETALGFIICAVRRLFLHDRAMRRGEWRNGEIPPTTSLFDKKVGLVGFGYVAREFARLVKPFRVQLLAHDPYADPSLLARYGAKPATLEEIFSTCSIVSLHAGLTEETRRMIGRELLSLLPREAIIVNTARGGLIDTEALLEVGREKGLFLGLDVFEEEPLPPDHPLRSYERAFLSPHLAGPADDALSYLGEAVIEDVRDFLRGKTPKGLCTKDWMRRTT